MLTRHLCAAALLAATAHAQTAHTKPAPTQPAPPSLRDRAHDLAERTAALTRDAAALAKDATVETAQDVQRESERLAREVHDHVATNLDAWYKEARTLAKDARARAGQSLADAITAGEKPLGLFTLDPAPNAPRLAALGSALAWSPLDTRPTAARIVLLVHGLDESGDIWDELAPALAAAGHTVVRFEYPNDQAIAASAGSLADALAKLRSRGVTTVDIVAHSMGGLVTRDALTRPSLYASDARGTERLPAIARVIALGTPHHGSPWARLQPIAEAIELVARTQAMGDAAPLLGFLSDGDGQAGKDLRTDSPFLTDLNARPAPQHVAITSIVGDLRVDRAAESLLSWAAAEQRLAPVVGEARARDWTTRALVATLKGSETLGDGVVPLYSAAWPGIGNTRVVLVRAGHRGMLRTNSPDNWLTPLGLELDQAPAIPLILRELAAR